MDKVVAVETAIMTLRISRIVRGDSCGISQLPWPYWTVAWFLDEVVVVDSATMTLRVSRLVCDSRGGGRDNYHGLIGQ